MPKLLYLKTYSDSRGHLTVIEKIIPFEIKSVSYFFGLDMFQSGVYRYKKNSHAIICLNGSSRVVVNDGRIKSSYLLDKPNKCLIIKAADWHSIKGTPKDTVLMLLFPHENDEDNYIVETYQDLE